VDAQWAAEVTVHTISRISAHIPAIKGLPRPDFDDHFDDD